MIEILRNPLDQRVTVALEFVAVHRGGMLPRAVHRTPPAGAARRDRRPRTSNGPATWPAPIHRAHDAEPVCNFRSALGRGYSFSTVTVAGSSSLTVTGEPDDSVASLGPPAITAAEPPPAPIAPPIAAPLPPPRMPPRIAPPIAAPPIFAVLLPVGDSPSR